MFAFLGVGLFEASMTAKLLSGACEVWLCHHGSCYGLPERPHLQAGHGRAHNTCAVVHPVIVNGHLGSTSLDVPGPMCTGGNLLCGGGSEAECRCTVLMFLERCAGGFCCSCFILFSIYYIIQTYINICIDRGAERSGQCRL